MDFDDCIFNLASLDIAEHFINDPFPQSMSVSRNAISDISELSNHDALALRRQAPFPCSQKSIISADNFQCVVQSNYDNSDMNYIPEF